MAHIAPATSAGVTYHLQRTREPSGAKCARALWDPNAAEALALVCAHGELTYRDVRARTAEHYELIAFEHGSATTVRVERAWSTACFVPGTPARLLFSLLHSSRVLSLDLPTGQASVARVPIIPLAVAFHQSAISALASCGEYVAVGYEDGSVGYWQLPPPAGGAAGVRPPAAISLKRHAHARPVIAASSMHIHSADFRLAVIASGSTDGAVRLWDAVSGEALVAFAGRDALAPTIRTALLPPPGALSASLAAAIAAAAAPEVGAGGAASQFGEVAILTALQSGSVGVATLREGTGGLHTHQALVPPPPSMPTPVRVVDIAVSPDGRYGAVIFASRAARLREGVEEEEAEAEAHGAGAEEEVPVDQRVRVFALADLGRFHTVRMPATLDEPVAGIALVPAAAPAAAHPPASAPAAHPHAGACELRVCTSRARVARWAVSQRAGELVVTPLVERTAHPAPASPTGALAAAASATHCGAGAAAAGPATIALIPTSDGAADVSQRHDAAHRHGAAPPLRAPPTPSAPSPGVLRSPYSRGGTHGSPARAAAGAWRGEAGDALGAALRTSPPPSRAGAPASPARSFEPSPRASTARAAAHAAASACAAHGAASTAANTPRGGHGYGYGYGYAPSSPGRAPTTTTNSPPRGHGPPSLPSTATSPLRRPAAAAAPPPQACARADGWVAGGGGGGAAEVIAGGGRRETTSLASSAALAAATARSHAYRPSGASSQAAAPPWADAPNALAVPAAHSMARLEAELADLHAALGAGSESAPARAGGFAYGASGALGAYSDGAAPLSANAEGEEEGALGGGAGAPLSAKVLNMGSGARRFGTVPALTEPRPEDFATPIADPHAPPALSTARAADALLRVMYSADRELEVRSVEAVPEEPWLMSVPASHHVLLGHSLNLLSSGDVAAHFDLARAPSFQQHAIL